MKPRTLEPVMVAILAEAGVARAGALAMNVPDRDVDDIVQDAIVATWRRSQRGDLPTDREALRVYIFVTAKNVALDHWRKLGRVELPGMLPEAAVDPLPRLEARAALRVLPKPAHLRAVFECLAAGDSLLDVVAATGIPRGTIATRLRALRRRR